MLSLENAGSIVFYSCLDHNLATDIHQVEHATDRIAGSGICQLLFSASNPRQSVKSGRFSGPQKIELDDSFHILVRLFEQAHSGSLTFCECQGENIFEPTVLETFLTL